MFHMTLCFFPHDGTYCSQSAVESEITLVHTQDPAAFLFILIGHYVELVFSKFVIFDIQIVTCTLIQI